MRYSNSDLCAMVTSNASSTPVQSMEILLPSRSSRSTQTVSMLKWQALASYFMFVSFPPYGTLYSCDFRYTVFLLIRFWTHSRLERAGACRGKAPPSCLRKTALPLKSSTGAFIAAQPRHSAFQRKYKIRTLLLSETSSDYFCLVHQPQCGRTRRIWR